MSKLAWLAIAIVVLSSASAVRQAQTPPAAAAPNADPVYQQLRNISFSTEAVDVKNFDLRRDAAVFHLRSGRVCFLAPVQGKVTGAVFNGDGAMSLDPPTAGERASLRLLTKSDEFAETFSHLVLRFTDGTYDDIKRAGTAAAPCGGAFSDHTFRDNDVLKYNIDARILQDVLGTEPGGFFAALIQGKRYNGKELFEIDPHGAQIPFPVSPEEVEFSTYDENKFGAWAAFHLAAEYGNGSASSTQQNAAMYIQRQQLDTTVEKSAALSGKATTTFVSRVNGLRVVPFDLFPSLRVQSVTLSTGARVSFIQEDKKHDADFWVILPKALAAGEKCTLVTTYSGKDAVENDGSGNYSPVARDSWYPNQVSSGFGNFVSYDMTFHIPKGMKIAATGSLVSESRDGNQEISVWKSDAPQPAAGFNFGLFKEEEAKLNQPPKFLVQSYANQEPPDWVKSLLGAVDDENLPSLETEGAPHVQMAMGTMNTTPMLKQALGEGEMAVALYTNYFGPTPYSRVAITQQSACNYGQSWPELVWLPICSFFDDTVRHNLGLDFGDRGYWKVVTPHEVAHQWWGHTVGFASYRDQWMSEGFADFSASLFIQAVEKNPKKFADFWNDEHRTLTERNKEGFRAIDAGPLTLGYRLSNTRTGFNITRDLIYPKGAFVLHMIRMMMWDPQTGDQNFKDMMHDFVKTYSGRAASTEDFKAIVEKHMTPRMDLEGNHRMDWFFNEYVYGTALPKYEFVSSFEKGPNGDVVLSVTVKQSGVNDGFLMLVPVYLELADGRVAFLGRIPVKGNSSNGGKVALKGVKDTPKRAMINYHDDVLAAD